MKLPNGERADLGTTIEDYVLNPVHREGKHTARVFESVLGITLVNADVLRIPLVTPNGRASAMSVWIVRHGESFPRLTTC